MNVKRSILVLALIVGLAMAVFCVACGDDDDDDSPASTTTTTIPSGDGDGTTDEAMEDAINYAVASISQDAKEGEGMEQMNNTVGFIGLGQQSLMQALQLGAETVSQNEYEFDYEFTCGTVSIESSGEGAVIIHTFNGAAECGGVTGTVKHIVEEAGVESVVYHVEYINLDTGDGCIINGNVTVQFSESGGVVTTTYTYDNLSVCGEVLNGSATATYDPTTGEVTFQLTAQTTTYEDGATVETQLTYSQTGGVSGSAEVDIEGDTYTCTASDLSIDWACGLPTSGSITVIGPEGVEATVDFSNTTCANPEAEITIAGQTFTVNLETAAELYEE